MTAQNGEASSTTAATDEALMAAYASQGDQRAFEQLFSRYAPQLLRLMRAGGVAEAEGQDLVQQTFLQLHRARKDYRADRPLRPWLLTIAYNLKRDLWRRRGRRPEVALEHAPEQVNGNTPASTLERQRQAEALQRALAALPDEQRQVIELHWFGGVPMPEIAETMGASLSAVKVRAHRGYKRLRRLLEAGGSGVTEGPGRRINKEKDV
jgi:RNA polymerase sigma-70 factor (ECF subfamily)